jgi:membrane-associated phospholipid phosphatase
MRKTARWRIGLVLAVTAALAVPTGVLPASASASVSGTANISTISYWNDTLLEAFRRQGGGPTPLARAAAMMHLGVFNVLNSGHWSRQGGSGFGLTGYRMLFHQVDASVDDDLAAGIAARDLLVAALPEQSSYVNQRYHNRHGSSSQPAAEELAAFVVGAMLQHRANDGAGDELTYQFADVPGAWRLTGHLCTEPVTPHWGQVTPFAMTSPTQFRQPLPGGHTNYADLLASELYADQFDEVKSLGRYDSSTRTADQTEIAWFWANDLDGTYKPPGQLLRLTWDIGRAKIPPDGKDPEPLLPPQHVFMSRLFAWTSMALADAAVAAWDQKYQTSIDLWRPETAIKLANTDGNPATTADSGWEPLSADESGVRFNPCFPAWVSGHATFGAAWAGVMRNAFGDSATFTATTEDPHAVGVTRTYTSFTQAAEDNALSRIYLGVHFRFDGEDGLATGFGIADYVHSNFFGGFFCNVCT